MNGHAVESVQKQERVHIVTCECGDSFDSMEPLSLAQSYHDTHIRIKAKQAQS